jgi:Flp pilus assembly protein TadG
MSKRRGNTAVLVSLALGVMLGFGALVLNVSYGRHVHQELQNAADAGAHAASLQFDFSSAGVTAAHNMAVLVAGKNTAGGSYVHLDANLSNDPSGDVVTGYMSGTPRTFTPSTDATIVNTVKVRAHLDTVHLLFSALGAVIGGASDIPVSAEAVVSASQGGGAGAVNCFLPLAIPECLISRYGGVNALQSVTLNLNPAGIDNMGWARPDSSPNASWVSAQIGNCRYDGEVAVGDQVYLGNGELTSVLPDIINAITRSTTRYGTTRWGTIPTYDASWSSVPSASYGRTYEGAIMVFDGGPGYCIGSGGAFNGSAPVMGFMWGAVYDVHNKGSAGSRTLKMRLDPLTNHTDGVTRGGGPNWGVTFDPVPPHML